MFEIKFKMESLKRILKNPLTLRILNCNATFLLVIAVIFRLAYFAPKVVTKEAIDSQGKVSLHSSKQRVLFWFVIDTIFILPPLIVTFVLIEFNVKQDVLAKYFNFLAHPMGKGVYLIMLALMIVEVEQITEIIFCIVISVIGLSNLVIGAFYIRINHDPNRSPKDYMEKIELQSVRSESVEPYASGSSQKVSAHTLTMSKISQARISRAEDEPAEQLQFDFQHKTAPTAAEDEFCIEKQNVGSSYLTDSKKNSIKATLDDNLTLRVPKGKKLKKKNKRAQSALA
jgi:hypothetical protein